MLENGVAYGVSVGCRQLDEVVVLPARKNKEITPGRTETVAMNASTAAGVCALSPRLRIHHVGRWTHRGAIAADPGSARD